MADDADRIRLSIDLPLAPGTAFDAVTRELESSLARHGIHFERRFDGRVKDGDLVAGHVTAWEPGHRAVLRWHPAPWQPELETHIVLTVSPTSSGSTVAFEHGGWSGVVTDPEERAGWFAGEVVAGFLGAASSRAFGDWLTDRRARRPSGASSRATYADPLYHYPNFTVILEELALDSADSLIEVGCGGGALLKLALASGCRAAAIDHSAEMVRVAREVNAGALADGRLTIVEGDAARLPFDDQTFTKAAMTGVLGFLPDPVAVFKEIRRVLRPGGRFVGLGSDPELRGTPAAPEPMASRLRFYETEELERLARAGGFSDVRVVRRDLEPFARDAGVPPEHLSLFKAEPGEGARFLVCAR